MKNLLILFLLIYSSCGSSEANPDKKTGRDTDYHFGPIKDTIPVNATTSNADFEVFGELRIGQPYMETIRIMGVPASKSKPVAWEADGLMHEDWNYKARGIMINMSSDPTNTDKTRAIFSITARNPCTLTTTRKIGIGSSYAEVMAAYKGLIDASMTDNTVITVGSVYGGIVFSFEGEKVHTIFLGAVAE
jgi:hypothetical protein